MSSYIESISQAATASSGKSTAKSKDDAIMGKQDFLTLLVTQLQNQDPLNPDDPTEFTAQLAQFSSLEQLFTLNESMNNLVNSNANADRLSTLSTIGKEVAYTSSSFSFDGTPVEIGYQIDGKATEVTLQLQLDGVTQATLRGTSLSAGNHYLTWDGLTKSGAVAPVGKYKIVVSAKAAEGSSIAATPLVKSAVSGVDLGGDGGGTLITNSGEVAFNTIIGVYDPKKIVGDKTNEPNEATPTVAESAATTSASIAETADNVATTVAVAEELL
jgi:flagellar basal-body rod modification protein FlgD